MPFLTRSRLFAVLLCAALVTWVSTLASADSRRPSSKQTPAFTKFAKADLSGAASLIESRRRRNSAKQRNARVRSRTAFARQAPAAALRTLQAEDSPLTASDVWQPLRLASGERVTRFIGERSARITDSAGRSRAVESSSPLRSDIGDGRERLVDLSLVRSGQRYQPRNPLVETSLPAQLGGAIQLGSNVAPIDVAGDGGAQARELRGRLVYPNALKDTDMVAEPTPTGVELSANVRSKAAPESFSFTLPLTDGESAELAGKAGTAASGVQPGSIRFINGGRDTGRVSAPVAVDASGTRVESSLTLDGNRATVHFKHHGDDFQYPLAVDPYIDRFRVDSSGNPSSAGSFVIGNEPGAWSFSTSGSGAGLGGVPAPPTATTDYNGPLTLGNSPRTFYGGDNVSWSFTAPRASNIFRVDFLNLDLAETGPAPMCVRLGIASTGKTGGFETGPRALVTGPGTSVEGDRTTPWAYGQGGGDQPGDRPCNSQTKTSQSHFAQANHGPAGTPVNSALFQWYAPMTGTRREYGEASLQGASVFLDDSQAPTVESQSGTTVSNPGPGGWVKTAAVQTRVLARDAASGAPDSSGGLGIARSEITLPGSVALTRAAPPCDRGRVSRCPLTSDTTVSYSTTDGNPDVAGDQPIPEGNNRVAVKSFDILEKSTSADLGTVKVDRSRPTVTATRTPAARWTTGKGVKYDVVASDPYSGVKEIKAVVDGRVIGTKQCALEQQRCEETFTFDVADTDENYASLSVTDWAGNVWSESTLLLIDDRAPTISFSPPATSSSWYRDGDVTGLYKLSAQESTSPKGGSGSGINTFELRRPNGEATQPVQACSSSTQCSSTASSNVRFTINPTAYPEGRQKLSARSVDLAGNPSPWADAEVRVDRTGPVLRPTGDLYASRGRVLTKSAYSIHVDALDGSTDDPKNERVGARQARILVKKASAPGSDFVEKAAPTPVDCPFGNCSVTADWTLNTSEYEPNTRYTIRTVATDQLGQSSTKDFDVVVGTPLAENLPLFSSGAGLEDYWDYETVATGAGSKARVKLDNGNMVWQHTPIFQKGRGLSTYINLTYNSQESQMEAALPEDMAGDLLGQYNEAGRGFSLGGPGVTRINDHLDVTLATLPAGGPIPAQIGLTDADGTVHRFESQDGGETFQAPAGVQLQLRRFQTTLVDLPNLGLISLTDSPKAYAMTRPDGVTYYFDSLGYQTSIVDRNSNKIEFTYEWRSPTGPVCKLADGLPLVDVQIDKVCIRKVVAITDPAGRDLKITYKQRKFADLTTAVIPAGDLPAAVRDGDLESAAYASGPVDSIVDQRGRRFSFSYDEAGYLRSFKEADGWTNAAGDPDGRSWGFDYEPAETGRELLKRRALTALTDPRGSKTTFAYASDSSDGSTIGDGLITRHRVSSIVDRGEQGTSTLSRRFSYGKTCALASDAGSNIVYDARGNCWEHHTDNRGRPTESIDPQGTKTQLGWDEDNNPSSIKKAAGTSDEATTSMNYNANGQMTSMTDPRSKTTTIEYFDSEGPAVNQSPRSKSGVPIDQGKGFVSDVKSIKKPRGNTTSFTYDTQNRGNRLTSTDGEGKTSRTQYDALGQITDEYDELGNRTQYQQYDPNGLPQTVIDARNKVWKYTYDAAGNELTEADPRAGGSACGGFAFTTRRSFDAFDRPLDDITPKSSASCDFITRQHRYDANGNAIRDVDGKGNATTRRFTSTDQPDVETPPSVTHANGVVGSDVTKRSFDVEDDLVAETSPGGTVSGAPTDSFSTAFTLDELGRKVVETRRSRGTGLVKDLTTSYAYDRRGNVVGMGDPRHNKTGDARALVATAAGRRFTYEYDKSDNRTAQIEDPAGVKYRTEYRFDDNDNPSSVTDPRGTATTTDGDFTSSVTYDGRDDRTHTIDGQGRDTEYKRRDDGRVKTIVSPKGTASNASGDYETTFEYWPTGELKKRTLPWDENQYGSKELSVNYEINDVGDPMTITDPRGKTVNNTFFDTGELATTDRASWWKLDGDTPVERDPAKPESGDDGTGGEEDDQEGTFGDHGAVEAEAAPLLPKAGVAKLTYDKEMQLTHIADADNNTVTLSRDALGRMTGMSRPLDGQRTISESYGFDANGNQSKTTDPTGAVTTRAYDQFDRVSSETRPGSAAGATEVTGFMYDENGNTTTVTRPRGAAYRTQTAYDNLDRRIGELNGENDFTRWYYDAVGNVTLERSPKGNLTPMPTGESATDYETRREYNANNELTKVIDGAGQETRFDYDANGNQKSINAPGAARGPSDAEKRQITLIDHDGRDLPWVTTTGDDDNGADRVRRTVTEYDPNGYLRRQVNAAGVDSSTKRPSFTYSSDAQVDSDPAAAKNATVYEYRGADPSLRTSKRLPWNGDSDPQYRQDFAYQNQGWIKAIDPPHDGDPNPEAQTTYTRFSNGWTKTSKDGSGQEITFDYDGRGAQTSWQSSGGRKMTRSYWPSGKLRKREGRRDADQKLRTYEYEWDKNRNLSKTTDNLGTANTTSDDRTTVYDYDQADRQKKVDEGSFVMGGDPRRGKDTQLVYDKNGNVKERYTDGRYSSDGKSYAGGKRAIFTFDRLDREQTSLVTQPGEPDRRTTTEWWPSGQRRSRTTNRQDTSKNTTERRYYFTDGRMSRMDRRRADQSGDTFAKNQAYEYDANGNRTRDERGTHEFNARDQLERWTKKNQTVPTVYKLNGSGAIKLETKGAKKTEYTYKPGGERLDTAVASEPGFATSTTKYTYDAGGLGEVKGFTVTGGGTTDSDMLFKYDEFGRKNEDKDVKTDKVSSYTYDALDRRDTKESEGKTFDYSYVGSSHSLSQEQQFGGVGEIRTFDYDSGMESEGMVRRASASTAPKYRAYSKDANGSIEGLENDTGDVGDSDKYAYDPYGRPQKIDGSDGKPNESGMSEDAKANPFRFEGFYADSGSGTYDMQARAYLPESGRFLSEDRYESATADLGLESDVLTQDRYSFAGGNPVTNVEIDGHCPTASMCPKRRADGQYASEAARKGNSGGGGSASQNPASDNAPSSGQTPQRRPLTGPDGKPMGSGGGEAKPRARVFPTRGGVGALPPKPGTPRSKPGRLNLSDAAHGVLGAAGGIPAVGAFADGPDAALYAAEGDKEGAGLAAAGAVASFIPGADQANSAARLGRLGAKATDKAADGAKGAKQASPGRGGTVRHYTSEDAGRAIEQSGRINPSRQTGKAFFTRDRYSSGVDAERRLSLPSRPDGYFEIPEARLIDPTPFTRVRPHYGKPGGGSECTVSCPTDVSGLKFHKFNDQ